MGVHEVAEQGFGREAEAYERSRPTYPDEAVAWLVEHLRLGPGAVVADLAAGSGKLTRLLVPSGARVVAVEPVAGMRAVLRQVVPEVPVVAGTAEAMPLRSGSLDAVTVGQAFHWFDAERAFAELARVLRPGGRLGLLWNGRDRSTDWISRVWAVMDRVERNAPWRTYDGWQHAGRPSFGPLNHTSFDHAQVTTPAGVVDRIRGVSHVAALDEAERDAVLAEVGRILADHPDTRGRAELRIPYRTDCHWTERR